MQLQGADISEARDRIARLEQELAERDALLRDADRRLQELIYVTSHDLTEPLRMVKSFLDLLVRRNGDQLDERSHEFIAYAVDGADRMKALIEDLLRYSRVGSGRIERMDVDLGEVLTGVIRTLGPLADQEDTRIEVREPLPVLHADVLQVSQLLQNLIANAAKFHPVGRGSHVVVSATRDEDRAVTTVQVADDGIGVAADHIDRIFKPFQRLHARDEYEGNGIGLAICQRIAERHGGDISVHETPGGGATFVVTFPDEGEAEA